MCIINHYPLGNQRTEISGGLNISEKYNTIYSTSTRPGEGAIYRYLSRQGKIAGDIHETKSSGLSLS